MLEEFRKAQQEKEKEESISRESTSLTGDSKDGSIILPESADLENTAEDGKPLTPQIEGIMAMRDELAEEKPTVEGIVKREDRAPSNPTKTVNSNLGQVPKLCDQCYLIDKCPHYQPGAECYFRNEININDSRSMAELMKMMLEIQGERVLFGRLIEQSEGGYIDQNLSKEMKMMMDLMKDYKEVLAPPKEEITIKASGPSGEGGGGGGILSQIFGGGGGNQQEEERPRKDIIDYEDEDE